MSGALRYLREGLRLHTGSCLLRLHARLLRNHSRQERRGRVWNGLVLPALHWRALGWMAMDLRLWLRVRVVAAGRMEFRFRCRLSLSILATLVGPASFRIRRPSMVAKMGMGQMGWNRGVECVWAMGPFGMGKDRSRLGVKTSSRYP